MSYCCYKELPKVIIKGQLQYTQIKRVCDYAIYEQKGITDEMRHLPFIQSYEVIQIRRHNGKQIFSRYYEPAEYYPSPEEWGTHGWTFNRLEDAERKLKGLV